MISRRMWVSGIAVAGLLAIIGCGSPAGPANPVSGRVLINGKPASGVYLSFRPVANALAAPDAARTNEDGDFRLQAKFKGPAVITAFWPAIQIEGSDVIEGKDRFRGKYFDPQHPAATATIRGGDNLLPDLQLKTP
ncbi:MAG: hypothetical protein U0744_09520 [Gemmataceae bacterium]